MGIMSPVRMSPWHYAPGHNAPSIFKNTDKMPRSWALGTKLYVYEMHVSKSVSYVAGTLVYNKLVYIDDRHTG